MMASAVANGLRLVVAEPFGPARGLVELVMVETR
jgi:hypothetical protein